MTALLALLSMAGPKLIAAATVVGGMLLVVWRLLAFASSAGRHEQESEALLQELHNAELARAAGAVVSALGDRTVLDELHGEFDRK